MIFRLFLVVDSSRNSISMTNCYSNCNSHWPRGVAKQQPQQQQQREGTIALEKCRHLWNLVDVIDEGHRHYHHPCRRRHNQHQHQDHHRRHNTLQATKEAVETMADTAGHSRNWRVLPSSAVAQTLYLQVRKQRQNEGSEQAISPGTVEKWTNECALTNSGQHEQTDGRVATIHSVRYRLLAY